MKASTTYRTSQGFTLVELAIVITIIGILIGGVLKGQQLIDQARLAATINQVNNYRSALMIFVTKYDELPGDMEDPDRRIIGCNGCLASNGELSRGDGHIDGGHIGAPLEKRTEGSHFWLHLYKAGMITGVTDALLTTDPISINATHPAAKINGGFMVETAGYPYDHSFCTDNHAGNLWNPNTGCPPSPGATLMLHSFSALSHLYEDGNWAVLTPQEAASIDRKMDDGKPFSGQIRGGSLTSSITGCADSDDAYPESETSSDACTLGFLIEK